MAAKRLGSALTTITGTANQLLRVKGDESGFEFTEPASIPAFTYNQKNYEISDVVIDRASITSGLTVQGYKKVGLTLTPFNIDVATYDIGLNKVTAFIESNRLNQGDQFVIKLIC